MPWSPRHDDSYVPPKGNVLLLSCMDLRLLDEIVDFMRHDNLVNRYDHVVFAGAALGALGAPGAKDECGNSVDFSHWKQVFWDQLGAAVRLHEVQDVYILEHRHCGAYHKVFHLCKEFGDSAEAQKKESRLHLKYATLLEEAIEAWAARNDLSIGVHKFLMDLRGGVSLLR